jgi:predicted RND superfamily exporter protein
MDTFFKKPGLIVAVIGVITVFFALQIPRVELDNNNLRFVPKEDEARKISAYIDDTFGSSLFVLVGLERKYGTVFDGEFVQRIRDYVGRIEEIEIVDPINSIVSSDYITSDGDAIVVEKLVSDDFTGSPEEIAELKRRILSWDIYKRALVSDDFTATQILVPLAVSADNAGLPEVVGSFTQVRDIAREMFKGLAEVYVTGLPVISATVNEAVNADLILLVPLVIVVVLLILFFSFRRLSLVVLPLLTVLIAVIWSIGAMPLFGVKLSVISTVLPVILVAVGSAYGIHVVTHYNTDIASRGDAISREEHRLIVFELLRQIGKPVFLAALTTFVGFVSFAFTSVLPIREFGFFSSFGVVVSFGIAVTLIPSLLLIRGPKQVRQKDPSPVQGIQAGASDFDPLSNAIADAFQAVTKKKRFVLMIAAAVALISVYGLSKIVIDNVLVEYFKPDTDIYRSDRFIREKFGGSKVVSVVVEADDSETLLSPETLSAVDGLGTFLETRVGEVGKVMGFTDLIKRINQVFNADESPGGISAKALPQDGGRGFGGPEGGAFGFGGPDGDFGFGAPEEDAFGFGSPGGFGFGDFDSASGAGFSPETGAAVSGSALPERPGERTYTMEELVALFDQAGSAAQSMDANELIRELKKQINYEGASYYEIPALPERYGKTSSEELQRLVSNYLVLLSGNIDSYANDPLEPTSIKITVQLRTLGQEDTNRAIVEIENYVKANFPPRLRVIVGGSAHVEHSLNNLVVQSQLISVIISLIAVFIIIAVSNRSFLAGFIGIAPLSISILINFAVMGFLGIKLNIGTSMVASVSVGVGIDYTIHYIEAFKREYRTGRKDFLRRTFAVSGKAILINAVSVGAGFAVLLFSQFNMLGDLGLLIALTMGTSALISLTVIPVLLTLINPRFIRTNRDNAEGVTA